MKTLRDQFTAALIARGEHVCSTTSSKFTKFSRKEGGYYFIGKSGSLRVGLNKTKSIPCSDQFKQELLK